MNGLERLATIRNISVQKGKQWVHKDIFRLLNKEDLWIVAYNNIYARKKVGNECLNEFEIKKLREIKTSVMNETYSPVFIKKLPIHLSDQTYFDTDHIVIELIRIILESIFEPLFCDSNFGYIQNKNAHATLKYIEDHFKVCDFLIQGEFEKIYQSIDYNILTKVINKYVKDVRFNNLIRKLLNSGLLYNRKKERNSILKAYETTRLQELFLNIYINEFDNWIEDYLKISIKNPRTVHNIEFSKIQYVRYMDTWILGIETDQILALHIKKKVEFVNDDYLESFNNNFWYEPYEQPFDVKIKAVMPIDKKFGWKKFYELFRNDHLIHILEEELEELENEPLVYL
jgi:hypothetical protein